MKKLLLLLMVLPFALGALAAPEALYLVGAMNDWTLPGMASDSQLYELKKTGTTYKGTFEIPADKLDFKVFTSKATMWDKTAYGTENTTPINIFKDKSASVALVCNEKTPYIRTISISNWEGGDITIECSFDEEYDTIHMTLSGPGQPAKPDTPSIFVIGEFNDWQLPTGSSLNGAVSVNILNSYAVGNNYEEEFTSGPARIPAGKARYVYYYRNTVTGGDIFIGGPGYRYFIYDCGSDSKFIYQSINSSQVYDDLESARNKPFEIANYTGDELFFRCGFYIASCEPYGASVSWEGAPANDMPALNVLVSANGVNTIFPTEENGPYFRSWYGSVVGPYDLLFTTAQNPGDAEGAIWGVDDSFTMKVKGRREGSLVSGGAAIHVDGNLYPTPISVSIDYITHIVTVETYGYDPSLVENVWVIGYMSGWPSPTPANEDKFPCLTAVEPGVFEGIVECPAAGSDNEPEFRFKTDLNGWVAEGCLGSGEADFSYREVFFTDNVYSTYIVRDGLGNWRLPDWTTSGQVKMRVDLNNMELTLTDMSSSAIEEVADDSLLPERYFNLQGQPVENPGRGLYIRVRGDKSEKVLY